MLISMRCLSSIHSAVLQTTGVTQMRSLCVCLALMTSQSCLAQEPTPTKQLSSRALANEFDQVWQRFVTAFRAEHVTDQRLKIIRDYSQEANQLLAPYLGKETIRRVLPIMASAKVIDLKPSFLGAVREQSEPRFKATALLHFVEYLGNNRRTEECLVTLNHLKKNYGKLKYKQTTFAAAADEASYYFRNLAVGCEAPSTTGQDSDGRIFSLSDYEGKVVMLRFWGDWCPACRAMYPYERELTQRYRNRKFALIGVNSDPRKRCRSAQEKSKLTWRSFWDGGSVGGPIAQLYQVEDWPRIIIIDSNGVIRMNARGVDEDYVSNLLDRLIQEAEQLEVSDDA